MTESDASQDLGLSQGVDLLSIDRSETCILYGTNVCKIYRDGVACTDCPIDCGACKTVDCCTRSGHCHVLLKIAKHLKKNGWRFR